jgi:Asp-tRNA(Asn)/Glu-tRNA(Gln) amidotransferase A subunit family amidase
MTLPGSLAEAANALRSGTLTSEALTRALLERVAATDANVQAWACLDRERALAAARACDARRASGVAVGPLAGIGVGVKDIIATVDMPTQMGSVIYAGAQPAADAECIARLRRAGGFALGKTVTTEFAFMQPGKTRNPWSPTHTPGGSSSGSAAAVALGHVGAALATQTNGSIVRPAAFCGVTGFKPTHAVLPYAGICMFSPTLDTLGVMARNVADCARVAAAMDDRAAISPTVRAMREPPRLALLGGFPWVAVSGEQRAAVDAAVEILRRAGAHIEPLDLPDAWRDAQRVHRTIMLREGARELGSLQQRERPRMSAKLNAALDEGAAIDDPTYALALDERAAMIATAPRWLANCAAVISAPAPGAAPEDLTQTGDPACCTLWTLLGVPAVCIPIARAGNGLPLGMQLAARIGDDDGLLAVAQWCEVNLPWKGLI